MLSTTQTISCVTIWNQHQFLRLSDLSMGRHGCDLIRCSSPVIRRRPSTYYVPPRGNTQYVALAARGYGAHRHAEGSILNAQSIILRRTTMHKFMYTRSALCPSPGTSAPVPHVLPCTPPFAAQRSGDSARLHRDASVRYLFHVGTSPLIVPISTSAPYAAASWASAMVR